MQWGREYDERMQALFREYRNGFEAIKHELPEGAVQLVEKSLHDARVISYTMASEGVLEMILDCGGAMHYQCEIKLTFSGVSGLRLPEPLEKKDWLYDEIYAVEQGFELRVLMASPPSELRITAQDVSIEMLGEPKYME